MLHLGGEITPAVYSRLETSIRKRDSERTVEVLIDSPGGDLATAMKIGRLFRAGAPVTAIVAPGAKCASACVLALVGATTRVIGGSVAIHRPYTVDANHRAYGELQKQFAQIDTQARVFLAEMNIPPSLYDEMLRYPPESIRVLSKEELDRFRISGTDYVWEETVQRRHAQTLGIDRQTYVQRLGLAGRMCSTPPGEGPGEGTEQWAARLVAANDCRHRILKSGR